MKKSLIHLAVLQTAALALADDRKPRIITSNDERFKSRSDEYCSGADMSFKPIVHKEMLADKRSIHIGGGCSDIGYIKKIHGRDDLNPVSLGGITKLQPAQFGQWPNTGTQPAAN